MNVQEGPQDKQPEVEQLVDALIDGQLAKYLLDTDTTNDLIKEIAVETGLPRAAVRIAFKLLAPMLVRQAQAGVGWFGRRLVAKNAGVLASMPGYGLVAGKLMALRAKLDADVTRREQLEAILAGDRSAADIEHAGGLSQELRIGLRQLRELADMRGHLDNRFDEVLDRLNPQPPLIPNLLERNQTNRLKFGARRVRFLGRNDEMALLQAFLETDERFSWWLLTGSGGQGKSRLALELCLRAGTAWRAGFLSDGASFDWDTWQPESATLIVVDYVATRPQKVREIITSLLNREHTDPLDAPVRLLLLERSKERTWWDKLITNDSTGYAIERAQFDADPLDLGPMTDDDLWQTIASVLTEAGKALPDGAETLAALRQIDSEGRPLFAAFAADALVSSGNIRDWDRERLLRDVLERERKLHWRPIGVTKPYENVLCLATMTGGLPLAMLSDPPDIEVPKLDEFDPATYQAMIGLPLQPIDDGDGESLPALQPDILGEFFVLEHLKPPNPGTSQPAAKFHHAAWHMPPIQAFHFWHFLNRCKDDFLDHGTFSLLVEPASNTRQQRWLWASLAANLIGTYGNAGQLVRAARCVSLLKQLMVEQPDEAQIRLDLARGTYNLITAYSHAGQLAKAEDCLALLQQLEADHPDEREVRLGLAEASYNLIMPYSNAGQLAKAEDCLALLKELEGNHPDEAEVRLLLVKGAFNLINTYCKAAQPEKAAGYLALLQQLEADYPEEAEVRLRLTRGAFDLVYAFCVAGQLVRAEECLTLLHRLKVAHPDEAEVRFELTRGAVNLIHAYAGVGQLAEAARILRLLKQLAVKHADEAQVRLDLAKGAHKLIAAYSIAGQPNEARRLALEVRDALMSREFEEALRQVDEEDAERFLIWLRSLSDW